MTLREILISPVKMITRVQAPPGRYTDHKDTYNADTTFSEPLERSPFGNWARSVGPKHASITGNFDSTLGQPLCSLNKPVTPQLLSRLARIRVFYRKVRLTEV